MVPGVTVWAGLVRAPWGLCVLPFCCAYWCVCARARARVANQNQDWSGDGIESIKIRETNGKRTAVEYKAGAFGYMFDFALIFEVEPESYVRFEVISCSRSLSHARALVFRGRA